MPHNTDDDEHIPEHCHDYDEQQHRHPQLEEYALCQVIVLGLRDCAVASRVDRRVQCRVVG